jgi:hypothetical protein
MRNVFALLALLGLGGIVVGVLTIIRHATGPDAVPFTYENYGGPGPLLGGLVLLVGGLYLRSVWRHQD